MSTTYDPRFDEWMATPPQDGARLVEGIYLYGNPVVGSQRFARGIFEPTEYPDENGEMKTWGHLNFEPQFPEQRSSLHLEMTLTLDGLGPGIIARFDRIAPEVLANILYVKIYSWIDPTAMDVPLVTPPPRFIVDEISLAMGGIQLRCSGPLLPNFRAGKLYTVEEYPGLNVGA